MHGKKKPAAAFYVCATVLIVGAMFTGSVGDATGALSDEAIINAFLKSPEILQAKYDAEESGFEVGGVQAIPYGSLCGAVGCQQSYLVIQQLSRKGTNPSTMSLMCLVHIGPKGDITSAQRVVPVPFAELGDGD